jgi:hypothetical protein
MRRRKLLVVLAALIILELMITWTLLRPRTPQESAIPNLKKGMTRPSVYSILGPSTQSSANSRREYWQGWDAETVVWFDRVGCVESTETIAVEPGGQRYHESSLLEWASDLWHDWFP